MRRTSTGRPTFVPCSCRGIEEEAPANEERKWGASKWGPAVSRILQLQGFKHRVWKALKKGCPHSHFTPVSKFVLWPECISKPPTQPMGNKVWGCPLFAHATSHSLWYGLLLEGQGLHLPLRGLWWQGTNSHRQVYFEGNMSTPSFRVFSRGRQTHYSGDISWNISWMLRQEDEWHTKQWNKGKCGKPNDDPPDLGGWLVWQCDYHNFPKIHRIITRFPHCFALMVLAISPS